MSKLHTKFGDLLKLERERQGVALADVSDDLKIAEDSLRNIEAGDADALPSELYFKMFSKSYAEHLGIDYGRTMEAMCEELGESLEPDSKNSHQVSQKATPSRASDPDSEADEPAKGLRGNTRRLVILASSIVSGFVIVLLVFQLFFTGEAGEGDDNTAEVTTTEAVTDAAPTSADEAYNWNVPTYAPPDSITLTLIATQESWATIRADGDTVLYQTLTPGRPYSMKAKYRFLVSIGVPRAVGVTIDDQPAYLASAETGRISRVEIDQTNRDAFRSPPQPVPAATTPARTPEARTDDADSSPQESSDTI